MLRTSGLFFVLKENELEADHHKKKLFFFFLLTAQQTLKQVCFVFSALKLYKFLQSHVATLDMCVAKLRIKI